MSSHSTSSQQHADPAGLAAARLAVQKGWIGNEQLEDALAEQSLDVARGAENPRSLGAILVGKGYLADDQWMELTGTNRQAADFIDSVTIENRRMGALLVRQGVASHEQVEECLRKQAQVRAEGLSAAPRLGEMLVERGHTSAKAIADALVAQSKAIFACASCSRRYNIRRPDLSKTYRCRSCGEILNPATKSASVRVDESGELAAVGEDPAGPTPAPAGRRPLANADTTFPNPSDTPFVLSAPARVAVILASLALAGGVWSLSFVVGAKVLLSGVLAAPAGWLLLRRWGEHRERVARAAAGWRARQVAKRALLKAVAKAERSRREEEDRRQREEQARVEAELMPCPTCGRRVARNAEFCPDCARPFRDATALREFLLRREALEVERQRLELEKSRLQQRVPRRPILRRPAYPAEFSSWAIVSFVLALVGLGPFAVICGLIALSESGTRGKPFAVVGLVLGLIESAAWLLLLSGVMMLSQLTG
jgi:ribosomal protein L37AE/L43A